MQSVLISINPKWCEKIASGEKTIEVRKTKPKIDVPFKCYIYQTKGKWIYKLLSWLNLSQGKIIGEFICDEIKAYGIPYPAFMAETNKELLKQSCCTYWELHRYVYDSTLYAWHISDLKIYDKPKELSEFNLTRPPQSWQYVESLEGEQ